MSISHSTPRSTATFDTAGDDGVSRRAFLSVSAVAGGGMLLAFAAACATIRFNSLLDAILLVFAVVNVPLFAVLMLGAFWRRATGHGAFAGLIAGAAGDCRIFLICMHIGRGRRVIGIRQADIGIDEPASA